MANGDLTELTDDEFIAHLRDSGGRLTTRLMIEVDRRGPEILDSEPDLRSQWDETSERLTVLARQLSEYGDEVIAPVLAQVAETMRPLTEWKSALGPISVPSLEIPVIEAVFHIDPSHGVLEAVVELQMLMQQTIKPLQDTADATAVRLEQAEHAQKSSTRFAVISVCIALASVASRWL